MAKKTRLNAEGLAGLSMRMIDVSEAIDKDINQFTVDIASSIAFEVAKATPIDTAFARANWITGLTPATGTLFPYRGFKSRYRGGKGGPFGERINPALVRQQSQTALMRRKRHEDIFIVNNTPYIARLDRGHSKQAPAGFVGRGVRTGIAKVQKTFKFGHTRRMK